MNERTGRREVLKFGFGVFAGAMGVAALAGCRAPEETPSSRPIELESNHDAEERERLLELQYDTTLKMLQFMGTKDAHCEIVADSDDPAHITNDEYLRQDVLPEMVPYGRVYAEQYEGALRLRIEVGTYDPATIAAGADYYQYVTNVTLDAYVSAPLERALSGSQRFLEPSELYGLVAARRTGSPVNGFHTRIFRNDRPFADSNTTDAAAYESINAAATASIGYETFL